jgi:hypothetical protein
MFNKFRIMCGPKNKMSQLEDIKRNENTVFISYDGSLEIPDTSKTVLLYDAYATQGPWDECKLFIMPFWPVNPLYILHKLVRVECLGIVT